MRIYLGDLGHYTIKLTNNCTPINIGFIAAYTKDIIKENLEFKLFRDPKKLVEAIKNQPPDVLALSNYIWCQSVSEDILQFYKGIKKDGCAVWGGPNFPMNELHKTKQYLLDRPYVDFYIPYEGEIPFSNIIKAILGYGPDMKNLKAKHPECFEGSFFMTEEGELVGNKIGIQLPDINVVPSPYLGGWMDQFLAEGQHPMFETQRGCPYRCTFCHTGLDYYNKGRSFTLERCIEEVNYIAKRVTDPTKAQLHITDSNFGMWPQDLDFTQYLYKLYQETGFPLHVAATTGKGRSQHVLKTVMSHPKLMLTNSVQSMDENVLKTIKRRNLPLEELQMGARELEKQGKLSRPEVILGLPNDSRETHLETLRKLMVDVGASIIYQYTLMLLPGTEIYTDKLREEHQYTVRYRLLPTAFGEYTDKKCFEIEEVSVATKSLSFKDYLDMREMYFFVMNCYSNIIYQPMVRYLLYLGDNGINFFLYLMNKRKQSPKHFANLVIEDYMRDTQQELFESREALIKHYSKDENYKELLEGREGKNLSHTYRTICLLNAIDWAEFITKSFKDYIQEKYSKAAGDMGVADAIAQHINAQAKCQYILFKERENVPSERSPIKLELDYNIPEIFKNRVEQSAQPHIAKEKVTYSYFMREDAIKYITSFQGNQRVVDLSLMILRMDPNYIFPIYKTEQETAVL